MTRPRYEMGIAGEGAVGLRCNSRDGAETTLATMRGGPPHSIPDSLFTIQANERKYSWVVKPGQWYVYQVWEPETNDYGEVSP